MRKKGNWFEGNIFSMPSKQIVDSRKYGKNVLKPTAVEVKTIKGKKYSRYYHKPLTPDEFWD